MNHSGFEEDDDFWAVGTRRAGTGERSSTIEGKSQWIEGLSRPNRRGIVGRQFNLWDSSGKTSRRCIILEEYLCVVLKADVNLMSTGSEVKRGQAECDYLLLAVYPWPADSSWGVNNVAWPQINTDSPLLLILLHCSTPDSPLKRYKLWLDPIAGLHWRLRGCSRQVIALQFTS